MKYDIISNGVSVCTGAVALANIQEVLSIIVLVISIANILFNMGYRVYNHIKDKHFEKIGAEIETAKEELEKLERKGKEND